MRTTTCQRVDAGVVRFCRIQPLWPFGRPGSFTRSQCFPSWWASRNSGSTVGAPVICRESETNPTRRGSDATSA